jgi:dTDP-4-amino-4,6-dideoxygalactose transaminase
MATAPTIPLANPRASYLAHRPAIDEVICSVLESGWYILGHQVERFEKDFAQYLGVSHVCGVANGTDALHLALRACGVGHGDGVVTVAHTAVATVAAVELCGATPILVDIDPATCTISPDHLEATLREYNGRLRLKAIVAVHLYGHPADMPAICELAERYGLWVIEDCAQAHGARIRGRTTAQWGHIAAFSFYPTKNLGAFGDGGAVATSDATLADRVRLFREYGWKDRYVSSVSGMNSRLDEVQAAILRIKLKYLDAENARRRQIAKVYAAGLHDTSWVLPQSRPDVEHVYHLYVVRGAGRDALRAFLTARGVGTAVHYPVPVHLQPAYVGRLPLGPGGLPVTTGLAREVVSLPMFPQLSESEAEQVAAHLRSYACDGARAAA